MFYLFKINSVKKITIIICCYIVTLIPSTAEAQLLPCPNPVPIPYGPGPSIPFPYCAIGAETIGVNGILTALENQIKLLETSIPSAVEIQNNTDYMGVETDLAKFKYAVIGSLASKGLIGDLSENIIEGGLKPMAAQIASSKMLSNIQNAKVEDAKNMQKIDVKKQQRQVDIMQEYKPSTQDFRFDSKGIYLKIGDKFKRSSSAFLTKMFSELGNNKEGYSSGGGPLDLLNKRWETFQKFCDPDVGKGFTGCENPDGSDLNRVNLHVMPSKTIFINYTMDFSKDYLMAGLRELTFNLTGFHNSSSLMKDVVQGAVGREKLISSRQYLAQMDAVNSMMYTIIGERFPTPLDNHIPTGENPVKQMRTFLGLLGASDTPSFYETRQSFVEELRSPEYYLDLVDNKNTIERKEVYLRAYGLILLNQLIEKQERISNSYAIETANLLQQSPVLNELAISSLSTGGAD